MWVQIIRVCRAGNSLHLSSYTHLSFDVKTESLQCTLTTLILNLLVFVQNYYNVYGGQQQLPSYYAYVGSRSTLPIHSFIQKFIFFPSNISFHSLYYYISLLSIYLSHTHTSTLKCIIIKFHTWTCLFIEKIPLIPSLSKPSFVPTLFMNPGLSTSVLLS